MRENNHGKFNSLDIPSRQSARGNSTTMGGLSQKLKGTLQEVKHNHFMKVTQALNGLMKESRAADTIEYGSDTA